ncbi:MAG: vanadium-dependent haloperoxidase [Opitutales bacterium]|nr:vanadium-dependent haloperoxidase [Opitutales bacterium]
MKNTFYLLLLYLNTILLFGKPTELIEWRSEFLKAVREESLSPNLMVRNLAIFSISVHDAVNSLEKKYHPYLKFHNHDLKTWDLNSVVAGCGSYLGKSLHPARAVNFEKLAYFTKRENSEVMDKSFLFGRQVARFMLQYRINDGATTTVTYIPRTSPGLWRRTPNFFRPPEQPHWRKVKTFAIKSLDDFMPQPPPHPTDKLFLDSLKEVKILGSKDSQIRSKEQTFIAQFWKDFSYTQTPPGHWNDIATELCKAEKYSLIEEARIFAMLNIALADSGIISWECKYRYHVWRPIHAIRHADQFPQSKKYANKEWDSLLESPAHPEYVSAHSFFSGTASTILAMIYGNDEYKFRVKSDQFPNQKREFNRFSSCAEEIGLSRLYGGIHYRFSNDRGIESGKKLGMFIYKQTLGPLTKSKK